MEKGIAVFGGAFNPVTCAHLRIAEQALMLDWVERVIFLPVGDYYRKQELLPARHRVAMLERVCDTHRDFSVSVLEAASGYPSYTYDSLTTIACQYPQQRVAFLMGSDNLKDLPNWNRCDSLLAAFEFIIIPRDGDDIGRIIADSPLLRQHGGRFTALDRVASINSTMVRRELQTGGSINCLVPDEVSRYLREHRLFGAAEGKTTRLGSIWVD